jgi:hypothetical protein
VIQLVLETGKTVTLAVKRNPPPEKPRESDELDPVPDDQGEDFIWLEK